MVGMETGGLFRLLAALLRPVRFLYQMWRPSTRRLSIAVLSDDLAGQVKQEEQRQRRALRAEGSTFMPVEFTAALQPHRAGEVLDSAAVGEIADYFTLPEQPHRRRLVVLGDAGSGKTVAATYLVLGLLDNRWDLADSRRAEEPIPVRVNAAGWGGEEDLSRWLTTRLGYDYRLRPNVAQEMLARGLILPVIDGLDEMDTDGGDRSRARALLNRLNSAPWRDRPAVVLCRTTEFDQLTRDGEDNGLHGATMITLQPLLAIRAVDYLTTYQHDIGTHGAAWTDIIGHLRDQPHSPLATALQTPWLLGLTATTLRGSPSTAPRLLACTSPDEVRELLFAAQIPTVVGATNESKEYRDYTSDNAERWLQSLAKCLQQRRDTGRDGTAIRLDEIWEIAGSIRTRILHSIVVAAGVGITAGHALWLLDGLTAGLTGGVGLGITAGLVVGLGPGPAAARVAWSVPGRSRWKKGLMAGLITGLTTGLVAGLGTGITGGLLDGLLDGLTTGLTAGLVGGIGVGLAVGLAADAKDQLALGIDARRLIRDDIQAAIVCAVLLGAVVALMAALTDGPRLALALFLACGSGFGLTGGLTGGHAAGRFYAAVVIFWVTQEFPRNPAVFLDWARRGGLLRLDGTAYQFRHETYQQWIHARAHLAELQAATLLESDIRQQGTIARGQ
ncbi:NACHT domain-containing protein [Nocardia rhamnosiphila]|uniref:NACHT domain-containing protein n=1 Tax=Nocardia rhamnosiphila TaxID=426716 RepID=A0ABV2WQR9_9NOCA